MMEDITILHLSDLHFTDVYSENWKYFLDDLKREIVTIGDRRIIVTVTGDIIDKGVAYESNKKIYDNALLFFKKLKDVLGSKVSSIFIVPGNHDKSRNDNEVFMIPKYRFCDAGYSAAKSPYNDKFYNSYWKEHLKAYSKENGTGYSELIKEVYSIFGMDENDIDSKEYISDTFGVEKVTIADKNYCFVLLNTAWSCIDNQDDRNLIFGAFQLEKLRKEYINLFPPESSKPDVTIVLGHHPLDSLMGKERDYVFNEIIKLDTFNANMYLCGHMHDDLVYNWINNRHSMNTFVTGFGWPDNGGSHVAKHTYAMYTINQEANSVDVYMRYSSDGGKYIPNFSIYTNDLSHDSNNKLSFPLKAHDTITYIDVQRREGRSSESHYLSKNLLSEMKQYFLIITRFSYLMSNSLEYVKDEFYDTCSDSEENEEDIDSELYTYLFLTVDEGKSISDSIHDCFVKNETSLFYHFWQYLGSICQNLIECMKQYIDDEEDIVRTHFRYLCDKKEGRYKNLNISVSKSGNESDYIVSDILYGQLIEEAHKINKGLIYSANKDLIENQLRERWTNFITIVPQYKSYEYFGKQSRGKKIKYPYITFGVTVSSEKYNNILYLMDYFSIKDILEDFIESFLDVFPIDIGRFCEWINKQMEEGVEDEEM